MYRRAFIKNSAALTAALLAPDVVRAGAHSDASFPVALTYPIGTVKVTALSDGFLTIGVEAMNGVEPDRFKSLMREGHISGDTHPTGVNAYLIEDEGSKTLIDAGAGGAFGPTLGQLADHLAALDVDPKSITRLIATHLHPDHIGGILASGSNPFTEAELVVSDEDLKFWTNEDTKASAPEPFRPFFDMATSAVVSFGDRLRTVTGEASIASGLTAMPLPGHTPGHMGVMLENDGNQVLFWGDIIHVPPVQFTDPSVTIRFDTDEAQAAESRAKVLDMAAMDRITIAGAHLDFPSLGYVEKAGSGYRWRTAPYPYG